jgi:hypothetical protein
LFISFARLHGLFCAHASAAARCAVVVLKRPVCGARATNHIMAVHALYCNTTTRTKINACAGRETCLLCFLS